jgi:hypothetical protein
VGATQGRPRLPAAHRSVEFLFFVHPLRLMCNWHDTQNVNTRQPIF